MTVNQGTDVYRSSRTDAAGAYNFDALAAGAYTVAVVADGFTPDGKASVGVTINKNTATDFKLATAAPLTTPGIVSGTVKNSTLAGINNATVLLLQGGLAVKGATTDSSGVFTIANVAPGGYSGVAFASGYNTANTATITITGGQTTSANFQLTPIAANGGALSGRVSNVANDAAIAGATVTVKSGDVIMATATTDAAGAYAAAALTPGSYGLTVTATGFSTGTVSGVTITAGATTTVNVALQATATGALSGRVSNVANDAPIAGATVTVKSGDVIMATATTDAAGAYAAAALTPGSYGLTVTATGFSTGTVSGVTITAGATTTVNVALQATATPVPGPLLAGSITGQVTDSSTGKPVGDSKVFVTPVNRHGEDEEEDGDDDRDDHQGPRFTGTNPDGTFTLGDLVPGSYLLHVLAKGFDPAKLEGVQVTAGTETRITLALTSKHPDDDRRHDDDERSKPDDDRRHENDERSKPDDDRGRRGDGPRDRHGDEDGGRGRGRGR